LYKSRKYTRLFVFLINTPFAEVRRHFLAGLKFLREDEQLAARRLRKSIVIEITVV